MSASTRGAARDPARRTARGVALSADPDRAVLTGEVATTRGGVVTVGALGSCVAVVALDPQARVGGIAHVMLPGAALPKARAQRTRHAEDGIRELLARLGDLGADTGALTICLVGGGNVLERDADTICGANIASVREVLAREGLRVAAAHLGGRVRRSCALDAAAGRVTCTVGGSPPQLLWEERRDG